MGFRGKKKNIFRKPTAADRIKKVLIYLLIIFFVVAVIYGCFRLIEFGGSKFFKFDSKENKKTTVVESNISIKCPKELIALEGMPLNISKIASLKETTKGSVVFEKSPDFNKPGQYNVTLKGGRNDIGFVKKNIEVKVISRNDALKGTGFLTGNGMKAHFENGILIVDNIKIANKFFLIPAAYRTGITGPVYNAYDKMRLEARNKGFTYFLVHGNKNYYVQQREFNRYKAQFGEKKALLESNPPGASDSQLGDSIVLNDTNISYAETNEAKWLNDNCYKYGFIIPYPKNSKKYTVHRYEATNLKYVGLDLAKKLYNKGKWISLEEYYGLPGKAENHKSDKR